VLSGDHLTMDPDFMKELDEEYVRTVYNCIINAPVKPVKEKNRQFATFDMMPTTLAALGVQIEGDRLALGTNLFSDKLTLTEEYGFEMLDKELQKKSEFYNEEFLGMTSSRDPFSSKESE
jgi:phosphoglycerol transferase